MRKRSTMSFSKMMEEVWRWKEEVARELRGAGVPLSFLRRYSEKARA